MSNSIEYKLEQILNNARKNVKIDINPDVAGDSVYKYSRDKLNYLQKKLDNGLNVLFIEDDLAVKSEVYMSVAVGHNQNPVEYEGLAHFLEHMLFIGSEAYPDPGIYNRLVAEAHGYSNAYTSDDHTLYYFDCRSDLVFNIMNVFCNFFVKPLFDPNYVDKEVTAVDYEHQKNVGSDMFRKWSLIDLFIKDSVNSRFRTGDKSTLKKEGVLDALREFYESYYTVDRMLLIVIHNNLDSDFTTKVEKIFNQIPVKVSTEPVDQVYPLILDEVNGYEVVRAEKLGEGSDLSIRFFLSDTLKNSKYVDKSYHVLSYILNHRGQDSLYKLLSDLHFIKSISTGIGTVYTQELGYDVHVTLTEYGLKNYQHVLMIILGFINKIRQRAIDMFDKYYSEIRELDILSINTMSRIDGTDAAENTIDIYNSYGTDLKYIRVYEILEDPKSMRLHFKKMLDEIIYGFGLRMKVIIMSDKYGDDTFTNEDEYYHTKYAKTVEQFDPTALAKYYDIKYKLPELNPYLPDSLAVIVPIQTQKFNSDKNDISKIDDPTEFVRLGSDNFYHLLKTNEYDSHHAYGKFTVYLSALSTQMNPIDILLLEFYTSLVREAHKPDLFLSSMAGNTINLGIHFRGASIFFRSFDSKLIDLLEKYLGWFYRDTLDIDKNAYNRIYTSLRNSFLSYEKSEPYTRLYQTLNESVNSENTISNTQFLYALQIFEPSQMEKNDGINFANLQQKAIELLSRGSVRGVMAGSINLSTAQKVVKIIDSMIVHSREFQIRPISNSTLNNEKENTEDNEESGYTEHIFTRQNKNEKDENIGLLYAIHLGEYIRSEYDAKTNPDMIREPVAYSMLSTTIAEKFFNVMRTENELGYYVRAGIVGVYSSGVTNFFLKFEIQTQEPDILNIVRNYVDKEFMDIINDYDNEQLQSGIKTSMDNILKDPINMEEKFAGAHRTQSEYTYEELDNIGSSTYLNRLHSIDSYNELQNLNVDMVKGLYEQAIQSHPRYVVTIMPNSSS
jgi:insulysin